MGGRRRPRYLKQLVTRPEDDDHTALYPGDRIAVVGGGPAGSFFTHYLLRYARRLDLELEVDVFEPRRFVSAGPAGCNHCGGIVSESLVQILAAEGILLPSGVIQRGIDSYVVHMGEGSVRIQSHREERSIAALYRGNGPRTGGDLPWQSFDGHVLRLALENGARLVPRMVSGIGWEDGLPTVEHPNGDVERYHLVAVASGINSRLVPLLEERAVVPRRPRTTRTYICELRADPEVIRERLGTSMHVFLLDIPRLEFAALIPKEAFVTVCLLGRDIDDALIQAFLEAPEVRACLPAAELPRVCNCSPHINISGLPQPFAERVVFVGDAGVTRLYKDGVGAAFRTAKGAAEAAVLYGVGADDFRAHYLPVCRAIEADNRVGKLLFGTSHLFKALRFAQRGVLRMAIREQRRRGGAERPMSTVLWNLFTGSAPYREILRDTMKPTFLGGLAWSLLAGNAPGRGAGGNGREAPLP